MIFSHDLRMWQGVGNASTILADTSDGGLAITSLSGVTWFDATGSPSHDSRHGSRRRTKLLEATSTARAELIAALDAETEGEKDE
jgi:hypothetical protein